MSSKSTTKQPRRKASPAKFKRQNGKLRQPIAPLVADDGLDFSQFFGENFAGGDPSSTFADIFNQFRRARRARRGDAGPFSGNGESDLDQIRQIQLCKIEPSPENNHLYRPVDAADPEIKELTDSIKQHGLLEALIVTADGYLVSGHRRYAAAKLAGLDVVPCRTLEIRREDDIDAFVQLLREHNRQRDKTRAEKLREEIVSINPDDAHDALIKYRLAKSAVKVASMEVGEYQARAAITSAKMPFLAEVNRIIGAAETPPSVRAIHYRLLNTAPLMHASKAASKYRNTKKCYQSLVDLVTRARLKGWIPMDAISDETRPIELWNVFPDPRAFMREERKNMFHGYYRDLMIDQRNHVEIIAEKNTIAPIIRSVAATYCIPVTTGRGYCSLPPRHAIAERFKRSGKIKLVLLMVTDHDPDGESIAESFARSMRDDFHLGSRVHAIKAALTREQVNKYKLPPIMQAKESSSCHDKFVDRHGNDVYELEALETNDLKEILRSTIEGVIDRKTFKAQVAEEKTDAAFLEGVRRTIHDALVGIDFDEDE